MNVDGDLPIPTHPAQISLLCMALVVDMTEETGYMGRKGLGKAGWRGADAPWAPAFHPPPPSSQEYVLCPSLAGPVLACTTVSREHCQGTRSDYL